ncbi:dipicolinate synthase [Caproiciproducens sp. NJN-50]|uniref:dipicolinate synthase subunit DpsA n=1 Tax=Acutalibacteraceae TaxID=3082771 RepID=UPI000FFE17E5|nr:MULTISPECIES: dipicolinate synthase subunit DpsA [Acutalibacteraceae]QAT49730.1 dipicolinate synthase [Caproiciproducens sp. NJN-50]
MAVGWSFGILGGDGRQIAMAESIASDGYPVAVFGFDDVDFTGKIKKADLEETINSYENVVLPLPVTKDGVHLKMDYSGEQVVLDDGFAKLLLEKRVFGGKMEQLFQTSRLWEAIRTHDFSLWEEFAVRNAVPTAEGAIRIAIGEYAGTLNGSRCLVAGFGRIGKVLAWMLRGIGANVTVSARKAQDLAWIRSYGYSAVLTEKAGEIECDMIFNTVPAPVFSRPVLAKMQNRPLIIDLASLPGGVDRQAAEELGIPVVQALNLPGKVAPKAAGEIIKETIYHILKE